MKNMIKTIALCGMLVAPAMNAGNDYSSIGSGIASLEKVLIGTSLVAVSATTGFVTHMLTKNNKYALLAAIITLATPLTIWLASKTIKSCLKKDSSRTQVSQTAPEITFGALIDGEQVSNKQQAASLGIPVEVLEKMKTKQ
jgi:hypothetical protein